MFTQRVRQQFSKPLTFRFRVTQYCAYSMLVCLYVPTYLNVVQVGFFFCYRETPEACEKLGGLTGPPIVLFLHTRARSEFDASAIILGTGIFEEVVRG